MSLTKDEDHETIQQYIIKNYKHSNNKEDKITTKSIVVRYPSPVTFGVPYFLVACAVVNITFIFYISLL